MNNKIWQGSSETRFATGDNPFSVADAGYYGLEYVYGQINIVRQNITGDQLLRLHNEQYSKLFKSIEKFYENKSAYEEYGFLWKRGFLLYGPPGTGKSSLIRHITEEFIKRDGIVIINDNPSLITAGLDAFREVEPHRPIMVILEDIDNIIEICGESDLLSLLDGANQIDNVIYIATTNYLENVPARIANRPSRFDEIIEVGFPSLAGRKEFLKSKIKNMPDDELELWAMSTNNFSIAHLKELIISVKCAGNSFEDSLKRLSKIKIEDVTDESQSCTDTITLTEVYVGSKPTSCSN